MVVSNILDAVHDTLDPTVWDAIHDVAPVIKPQHKAWIIDTVHSVLKEHGYGDMDTWLEVYLTGSLTAFQYSDDSDCDISLFVNTDVFPEWSRSEMIGIMISHFDGTPLPGTSHSMQGYVVARGIRPQDLYKPGLRSGYNIQRDQWVVPPEKDRSHDVANEQNADYQWALEQADKMERMLRYEPTKAVQFWHQIHMRRMSDQKLGKGDFSQSNIIYKFLANRGLFPRLEEATGEHIAGAPEPWSLNAEAIEKARQQLGLRMPVKVDLVQGTHGQYHGTVNGQHEIDLVSWLNPESASKQLWHEMTHALQLERDPKAWLENRLNYWDTHAQGLGAYQNHPEEIEAREMADSHFFPLVHGIKTAADKPRVLFNKFRPEQAHKRGPKGDELPFIYDPTDNVVHLGPPNSFHWELIQRTPELQAQYPMDDAYTGMPALMAPSHLHGRMEWPGKVTHFLGLNADNTQYRDATNAALGATSAPETGFEDMFSHTTKGQQYVGQAEASNASQPPSEEAWSFR